MNKILILVLALVLCSVFVGAEPFVDFTVVVSDSGYPIENAEVHLFGEVLEYYDFTGLTDVNGEVTFLVDSRIKMSFANNQRGDNDLSVNDIPIKETSRNSVFSNPMDAYRKLTVDVNPTIDSYNFEPYTLQEWISLRHNVVYDVNVELLENVVPILILPQNLECNEEDNHMISIDLNNVIFDDSSLEELSIDFDVVFSVENAEYYVNDEVFTINFFPSLNLDFHQDNTALITLTVNDSINEVEITAEWTYEPEFKAVFGSMVDVYTYSVVGDFEVVPDNGLEEVMYNNDEFIAFFELGEAPKMSILKDNYYDSNRLINNDSNGDVVYNFSLVPVQYDTDYEGDWHEDGFSRVFRGSPTGQSRRWEEEATFCVYDSDEYGYDPGQSDFDKVETTLSYVNEFTNELMDPLDSDGEHLIYDQTGFCDPNQNDEFGYDFIVWYPGLATPGAHSEVYAANGLTIIRGLIFIKGTMGNVQPVYNQEILQTMGATHDIDQYFLQNFDVEYWPPGESTFCDVICSLTAEPTYFDMAWGKRAYMRPVGNTMPDNDPDPAFRGVEFTEVVTYYSAYGEDGEKELFYKKLGYAPANQAIKRVDVLEELPKNTVLIKYEKQGKEIKPKKEGKLTIKQKRNIQHLLN
jgi:hypothetical protein